MKDRHDSWRAEEHADLQKVQIPPHPLTMTLFSCIYYPYFLCQRIYTYCLLQKTLFCWSQPPYFVCSFMIISPIIYIFFHSFNSHTSSELKARLAVHRMSFKYGDKCQTQTSKVYLRGKNEKYRT